MPNHCTNTLNITGPADAVERFVDQITKDRGDNNGGIVASYAPFPPALHGKSPGQAFTREGWSWRLDNWGTKWGDYDLEVLHSTRLDDLGEATIRFTTAWSPMVEGMVKVSAIERDLTMILEYREDDNAVLGCAVITGGEMVEQFDLTADDLPVYDPDNPEVFEQTMADYADDLLERARETLGSPR